MRQIDNMTPQEIETLALKGMTAPKKDLHPLDCECDDCWTLYHSEPAPNKTQPQHSWKIEKRTSGWMLISREFAVFLSHKQQAKLISEAYNDLQAHADKLEATLIGIKLTLEEQGGYENTLKQIDSALEKP